MPLLYLVMVIIRQSHEPKYGYVIICTYIIYLPPSIGRCMNKLLLGLSSQIYISKWIIC